MALAEVEQHVDVAPPDEPGEQGPEPRARQRPARAERDQAVPVDHAVPGAEGLAELPTLERRCPHAVEEPPHRAPGAVLERAGSAHASTTRGRAHARAAARRRAGRLDPLLAGHRHSPPGADAPPACSIPRFARTTHWSSSRPAGGPSLHFAPWQPIPATAFDAMAAIVRRARAAVRAPLRVSFHGPGAPGARPRARRPAPAGPGRGLRHRLPDGDLCGARLRGRSAWTSRPASWRAARPASAARARLVQAMSRRSRFGTRRSTSWSRAEAPSRSSGRPARAVSGDRASPPAGGRAFLEVEHRWSLDVVWRLASGAVGDPLGYDVTARAAARALARPFADGVWMDYPGYPTLRLFTRSEINRLLSDSGLVVLRAWGLHSATNLLPSTVLHRPRLGRIQARSTEGSARSIGLSPRQGQAVPWQTAWWSWRRNPGSVVMAPGPRGAEAPRDRARAVHRRNRVPNRSRSSDESHEREAAFSRKRPPRLRGVRTRDSAGPQPCPTQFRAPAGVALATCRPEAAAARPRWAPPCPGTRSSGTSASPREGER